MQDSFSKRLKDKKLLQTQPIEGEEKKYATPTPFSTKPTPFKK